MLNEFYQNIGIKGFLHRYGLLNAVKRGLFIANPIHLVKDYEIRKILWQKRAAQKVRKYMRFADTAPEGLRYGECKYENPIWIYWNTGIENAPEIVKRCYESVVRYSEQEVILLSEGNISNYIGFPKYIEEKKNAGMIPMAGYTDLMRFALLEHFGGTWIDATVLLTGPIPRPILSSGFFAFRNALGLLDNPVLFPAWLIHSEKSHPLITQIRNVAFAYWTKEKHVIEYLLPNLIITEVIHRNPMEEKKIPYMDSEYSERLIRMIADDYVEEEANWMKTLTSIHKLTYKLRPEVNKDQSIYRRIIDGNF